ncbi:hypothetical protein CEH05_09250 [Halobacillus halophilus]|uniref:tRNA(Met) cytidine acetate ligase n=1 Tax=Halobacillus halophilus (strain ATCC 35676 / DSM 2266 / JCM 20832 / KCTC 3685 / LMG 17431 / NBRC 102448 / NCIMB 2269) TaxID=866895 RepID=I0JM35_HALH3|nr:nucleotidyltransferase [Halobacillus halophilus]ASF39299.1 hypothetical protein CEH05_09250 [Halobacillus halophilus]CCG45205.1 hypothetical protein HBHAL_2857 [Halobacillus halophilus DSM 2266]
MKACGVIVEYNPFHNGHLYHLERSKETAEADCMIAIMSGNFLQRGEPAIIDKWHRAEAALKSGADLVLELPYIYAVEHSDYFSQGAVQALSEIGVESICFGSESGDIQAFLSAHDHLDQHAGLYDETVRKHLNQGYSFPEASRFGYQAVELPTNSIDLAQPNNILGYSYVKQILAYNNQIRPLTIKREKNHYHDETIEGNIASATSIRKELLADGMNLLVQDSIPEATRDQLLLYKENKGMWHEWNQYFSLLQHKILTLKPKDLRSIQGVDEGLEHRLQRIIKESENFQQFMEKLKTKRYTWTRLQRTLVHILTGTEKQDAQLLLNQPPPYVRVLAMSDTGKDYLRSTKKQMRIPLLTQPQQMNHLMLDIEERAAIAYYSVLEASVRNAMIKAEYGAPVQH